MHSMEIEGILATTKTTQYCRGTIDVPVFSLRSLLIFVLSIGSNIGMKGDAEGEDVEVHLPSMCSVQTNALKLMRICWLPNCSTSWRNLLLSPHFPNWSSLEFSPQYHFLSIYFLKSCTNNMKNSFNLSFSSSYSLPVITIFCVQWLQR